MFLGLKIESFIAIGIIKDHFIYMYRNSLHFFDNLPFSMIISVLEWKQYTIFLNHVIVIPKITCKQYRPHKAFKQDHRRPRNMFSIKEPKPNFSWPQLNLILLIVIIPIHILQFRILIENKHFRLMRTMNVPIVPQR